MTSAEEIELCVLGRVYRRISQLERRADKEVDKAYDEYKKILREGERRGIMCIGCVLVEEFAQPLVGRDENVFENAIFKGDSLL